MKALNTGIMNVLRSYKITFSNFINPDDSYFFLTGAFNSKIKDLNEILIPMMLL